MCRKAVAIAPLLQVRVSSARALSVAHLSANLRRSLNGDLERPEFEEGLETYLSSFSELVEEEWSSFRELQSFTTGHNLEIMFADRSTDMQRIVAASKDPEDDPVFRDRLDHLMGLLDRTGHYCMPTSEQNDHNVTQYMCFQLLGFRPSNKKYMQRLTNWAKNPWQGQLACAVLGFFNVDRECVSLDDDDQASHSPVDVSVDRTVTLQSCSVQTLSLDTFFHNNNIDYVHRFDHVQSRVNFDTDIVEEMLLDEEHSPDLGLAPLA